MFFKMVTWYNNDVHMICLTIQQFRVAMIQALKNRRIRVSAFQLKKDRIEFDNQPMERKQKLRIA